MICCLKLATCQTENAKSPNLDDVALLHRVGLSLQFHPNSYMGRIAAITVDTAGKSYQTIGLRMPIPVKVHAKADDNHLMQT